MLRTVRYYSRKQGKIVATFLAIAELEDGTALSIVSAIKKILCDVQLDPRNLLGVGVDNASVNVGINNGVCEMLKRDLELPNLIMVRCVCHSLQLALSHAVARTLPRNGRGLRCRRRHRAPKPRRPCGVCRAIGVLI